MSLILNIGHSRKVGEPNYGSRGASVNLQMEIEANVVRDPEELQRKIKYLFNLAKESVDEELSKNSHASNGKANSGGDRHANGAAKGSPPSNGRLATRNQIRALYAISRRQQIDLATELRRRFEIDFPDRLSVSQASELIDSMKSESAAQS